MFEIGKRIQKLQQLEGMEELAASYGESILTNDNSINNFLKRHLIYNILQILDNKTDYCLLALKQKKNTSFPPLKNRTPSGYSPLAYPRKYNSLDEAVEKDKVVKTMFNIAQEGHKGQKMYSGDDYFDGHIIPVGEYAVEESYNIPLPMQGKFVASALGHDLVEDTDVTLDEIKKVAGDYTAEMIKYLTKENNDGTYTFKMGNKRFDVALLMGIDRKRNMFTLNYLPTKKRRDNLSSETEQVYIPVLLHHNLTKLANDLSMLVLLYNTEAEIYDPRNIKYPAPNIAFQHLNNKSALA